MLCPSLAAPRRGLAREWRSKAMGVDSSPSTWPRGPSPQAELTLKIERVKTSWRVAESAALASTTLGPVKERPVLRPAGSQTSLSLTDLRRRHSGIQELARDKKSARSNSEFASTNTKCKMRAKVAEEGTTDELCKRRQMCPR